jgi:hypothetical protein
MNSRRCASFFARTFCELEATSENSVKAKFAENPFYELG